MPQVEILFFAGCPAYRRARERALAAMKGAGMADEPTMTLVRHARDAKALDFHGSPTVRIDGRDIDPAGLAKSPEVGLYSRVYRWKGKTYDAPPEEMIRGAVAAAFKPSP